MGNGFTLAGFGSFAALVAGSSFDGLTVLFADDAAGGFEATIVLHVSGSNAAGFIGRLDDTTLVLRGDVGVAAVLDSVTCMRLFTGLLVVAAVAH